ncbi:ABC transporter substrate-binding protein [Leucobacter celer]|jgi:peptide/nickel transport system substrate-binding protein|uniref:ABC transporter substrate-binding protein n=1 Tax=Leucobacter celer TaxID=668625 RepID=UPI0006A77F96|nr:ABC transporter substrate-binding protein [Leucobacter celer]
MTYTVRSAALLVAASASLVALAACSSGAPAESGSDTNGGGGVLRFGDKVVDCADPHQRGNNPSSYQLKPVTDSLLAQDPETGEYLPWLASEYAVNDDATEFLFTIREGVTFSDGTDLTPEAVATSLNAIAEELGAAASLPIGYLNDYETAAATDEHTVTVTFSSPNIAFLQGTATTNLGIVSEASAALSAEERCAQGVIGTGPFVIDSFTPGESLVYSSREDYAWGNPLAENQGAAYLAGLEIVSIQDTAVLADSLLSGQIDAYSVALAQDVDRIEAGGGKVYTTTNGGYPVTLVPNLQHPVLGDPAVRDALQIGIDRESAVAGVIGDWFVPSTSALSHVTVGYEDLSDRLVYDSEGAERILEEAGWIVGTDGIREKDGQRLSFDITGEFSWNSSPDIAAVLKEQLAEIGVEVTINLLPTGQQQAVYDAGEQGVRWANGYTPEPDTLRAVLGFADGNWNHRTESSEIDELLDRQVQLADVAERNEVLAEIQAEIIDEGYLIPIYDWAQSFVVSSKVGGSIQLPFLSGPGPLYTDITLEN